MPVDYHTHTYLCKHASGKPEEYLKKAEEIGLEEIGVCDHCPWPTGYDEDSRMSPSEFPLYLDIIKTLKEKSGKTKVRSALEIDWVPGKMEEVFDNIFQFDFDYIMGSIHYVDDFNFDHPDTIPRWKNESGLADKVWNRYSELLLDFVESCDFDIIGHLDLPKKFGFYPSDMKPFMAKLNETFKAASAKDMALEINTAGLRKPVKEIYPTLEILKLAKAYGMLLTLGSDAHSPEEVGADLPKAVELAKAAGYTEIATFEKRNPILKTLP